MYRCIQCAIPYIFLVLLGGFITILVGTGLLPQQTTQVSSQTTTPEQQKQVYSQLILSSNGFKLIIIGASLFGGSIVLLIIYYIYNSLYPSPGYIYPEFQINAMVYTSEMPRSDATAIPIASTATSVPATFHSIEPISGLEPINLQPTRLPSTTDEQPVTFCPKPPQTWNELKLMHLQGRTTLV